MNPNTLRADGTCPSCKRKVAEPSTSSAASPSAAVASNPLVEADLPASAVEVPKAPWHFKLLVVATVVYLAWRFVEVVAMVVT